MPPKKKTISPLERVATAIDNAQSELADALMYIESAIADAGQAAEDEDNS